MGTSLIIKVYFKWEMQQPVTAEQSRLILNDWACRSGLGCLASAADLARFW